MSDRPAPHLIATAQRFAADTLDLKRLSAEAEVDVLLTRRCI
jgi:hypothetical protein